MESGSFPPNPGVSVTSSFKKRQRAPSTLKIPPVFLEKKTTLPSNATIEPVRRKPLPASASPLTPKEVPEQTKGIPAQALQLQYSRQGTKSGPSLVSIPPRTTFLPPVEEQQLLVVRDLDKFPRGQSPLLPQGEYKGAIFNEQLKRKPVPAMNGAAKPSHPRQASDSVMTEKQQPPQDLGTMQRSTTMPIKKPVLHVDLDMRKGSLPDLTESPSSLKPPKTPGQKITSFFTGWNRTTSPGTDSSATEISENETSLLPSPMGGSPQTSAYSNRSKPPSIDTNKANANSASFFGGPLQAAHTTDHDVSTKLAEVESELMEISAELAASIKREMELEDLVEQLRIETNQDANKRTSDYFSDSGTSSVRFPLSELGGGKSDEMEKLKRRSDQERARLKVDMSQKWQEEQALRKDLEAQVHNLEQQIQQLQREKSETSGISEKARLLEASLQDAQRKLSEEKQVKDNFQDLLQAMHEQIEQHKNERDNLRDEIVPQLRARVEGLEAEAAESEKVTYDNARLQQEIQALRNENMTLVNAKRMQQEMQQQANRMTSIGEEGAEPQVPFGLKRSNSTTRAPTGRSSSLARSPSLTGGLARSPSVTGGLSRSNSLSGKDREAAKENLADRMKDIEMQRDALHSAVKSLLDRQAYQARETEKRVRVLEAERDQALRSRSPRRMGYEKEVESLREEINHLRRRGDDALEQKWQCEKGLGGLKMDLDRAEQETNALRSLLKAHDVLLPERADKSNDPFSVSSDEATSSSLRTALTHLQADRAAVAESSRSLTEERRLADQLQNTAQRTQDLAAQVNLQLSTNHTLRVRLAEAVGRGEREQKSSATKINNLQSKLKRLEDTVMVAQQQSEDSIGKHEADIQVLKESHSAQLLRVKNGLRTPTSFSPKSPLSPMFANTGYSLNGAVRGNQMAGMRSPRLDQTTSGKAMSMEQAVKTEVLEQRVRELEKALKEAESEMEEVVGRMNHAQIEVAELQGDRDEAMRQTRRLQAEILQEREKVKALVKR